MADRRDFLKKIALGGTTLLLPPVLTSRVKSSSSSNQEYDFYVAPDGNDANPGTKESPLLTLKGAQQRVRQIKDSAKGAINVWFRGGEYILDETVVFGLEDSGDEELTITYAAYPGETPVFSSGQEIKSWTKVTEELPGLPEQARGNVWVANVSDEFLTLYDDEGMLPRAQSEAFFPEDGNNGRNRLHFPEGKLKNWSNVTDVEIKVRPHHAWIVNILPLKLVDEKSGIATTSVDATYAMNRLHFLNNTKNVWVENVLEVLDEPGEWALNTKEGKVYLWPRNDSPVVAPKLFELIRVEGNIDKKGPRDIPVRNLHFHGLTFKHGKRYTISEDDAGLQHDWNMFDKNNALVRFRGAENCSVKKCRFLHSGSGAVRVDLHGINNEISGNHIEQMGGSGILLCGYGPGTKDVNKKNLVFNNHIHNVGEIYWHSPGIFVWQSGENRVAHNLVHHIPYTGIIISGVMTHFFNRSGREMAATIRWHEVEGKRGNRTLDEVRPYLHSHDNRIENNEIHHGMQQLNDGNGIYIRGAGPNNIIRRNYIHDMLAPTVMQSAIRTDGGQKDTLLTENVIYRCVSQGMQVKLNNHAVNNFIVDIRAGTHMGEERDPTYLKLIEGPMTGGAYKRNILYHPGEEANFYREINNFRMEHGAYAKDADTDYNIYYCAGNPKLSQSVLEKKQSEGVDANSLAGNPHFMDPENGEFRFKPESPALEMGIEPIDLSKIGLRKDT